jgi:hypothetical protein
MIRILVVLSLLTFGAREPAVACWTDPSEVPYGGATTLYAVNLPADGWSVTTFPYPIGTSRTDPSFTLPVPNVTADTTWYVWRRGHGKSLLRAGPQFNDYHVICIASVHVTEGAIR